MIYLTIEDLKTDSFERFIQESSADFQQAIDKAEKRAIGKVTPYLRDLYNIEAVFDVENPVRDELLVDLLSCFTLAKLHGRNSARKFNKSDEVDDAMKELDKIAAGKITLDLPLKNDSNSGSQGTSIWGNNSNQDFYL